MHRDNIVPTFLKHLCSHHHVNSPPTPPLHASTATLLPSTRTTVQHLWLPKWWETLDHCRVFYKWGAWMDTWWLCRRRAHGEAIQHSQRVLCHIQSFPCQWICLDLLYKGVAVPINPNNVLTHIQLPSLLSNALVVYRVIATYRLDRECNSKSYSFQLHATFIAHLIKRSDSPSAAWAHITLRSPFLPSHAHQIVAPTHTYQHATHTTSAHDAP